MPLTPPNTCIGEACKSALVRVHAAYGFDYNEFGDAGHLVCLVVVVLYFAFVMRWVTEAPPHPSDQDSHGRAQHPLPLPMGVDSSATPRNPL